MIDAAQVKALLNGQVEAVAAMLLPAGFKRGDKWTCGDADNTAPSDKAKGGSLVLDLSGPRVGCWKDFQTQESGDLISLWMRNRGCGFREAIEQISDYLGIKDDGMKRYEPPRQSVLKKATGPKKQLSYEEVKEGSEVWKWLTDVRKVSAEAIRAYRVGESFSKKSNSWQVIFPFFDVDGNLVRLKGRGIEDKAMWQWPSSANASEYEHGSVKLLWGMQAVPADSGSVCITEGELDAMSMFDLGFYALSLPEGAQVKESAGPDDISKSHDQWLIHDTDWLNGFTDILMALDGDEPGRKATDVLCPRLGRHRVRVIDWPEGCKDANDAAQKGVSLVAAIKEARNMDPADLRRPGDMSKEIWDEFYPEEAGLDLGQETPWSMPFRFTEGALTIWHGWSGHGKTVCQTHVLATMAMRYGTKVCIASLEWPAAKTFKNMFRQMIGVSRPTREQFNEALDVADKHFMVYDHVGEVSISKVIEVFEYTFRKYGVKHFALDSLMMLRGVADDDYTGQKAIVQDLKAFATKYNVHVHLVAHSKKPDARHPETRGWPGKHDISGSANLSNVADNVVCVWRKLEKEDKLSEAYALRKYAYTEKEKDDASSEIKKWERMEDAMFVVQKQRATGEQPKKRLWFDKGEGGSWQYREDYDDPRGVDMIASYLKRSASASSDEEVF